MSSDNFKQYTTVCYSGVELLKKYSLGEYGTWKIDGEDPNCDWGGPHYQPHIATLEGKLEDVLRQAVEMPQFWQWGSGGTVTRLEIKKVTGESDDLNIEYKMRKAALKVAQDNLTNLQEEIASIEQTIAKIEVLLCPGCAPGSKCRTPKCRRLV